MKKTSIDNLVVTRFDSKILTPALKAYKHKSNVFRPESCSKQLWVGSRADFKDIVIDKRSMYYGHNAYSFLLSFIDGALSKKKFENHAKSQFFSCWRKFKSSKPFDYPRHNDIIKMLDKDSVFIRKKYSNQYKIPRHEVLARDLSHQKSGEPVLIISDYSKFGGIHEYTVNIIKASDNIQKSNAPYLTITHPSQTVLRGMRESFNENAYEFSRRTITFAPFETLDSLINKNSIVYNGLVMTNSPVNGQIIQAWKARGNRDARLTHIRGTQDNRGQSSVQWMMSNIDKYISPEDIQLAYDQRLIDNRALQGSLQAVYKACADLRAQGRTPSYEINRGAYVVPQDIVSDFHI